MRASWSAREGALGPCLLGRLPGPAPPVLLFRPLPSFPLPANQREHTSLYVDPAPLPARLDYGKDPKLKGVRQFQTQPQKRGQTADNWGGKKYEHLPLFDVRAPPSPIQQLLRQLRALSWPCVARR